MDKQCWKLIKFVDVRDCGKKELWGANYGIDVKFECILMNEACFRYCIWKGVDFKDRDNL